MNKTTLVLSALVCLIAVAVIEAQDRVLFSFDNAEDVKVWQTVNDGVMGGRSVGRFKVNENKKMEFFGTLSLENNGGFASVRARGTKLAMRKDESVVIRVRGDGRKYNFNLYSQSNLGGYSYRQSFQTEEGKWITVRMPVEKFIATWRGRTYPDQKLDPSKVSGMGILLGDKNPGKFKLEVEWIKAGTASAPKTKVEVEYRIMHWNVESGGNDPNTIASQLIELGLYDIVALSEVADPEPYVNAITQKYPDDFDFIRGKTGINKGREDDRLLIYFDNSKFNLIGFAEMQEAGGVVLNDGRHKAPLYVRIKDRNTGQEMIVLQNHLARGDAEFRDKQAGALREWARTQSVPMIAIGSYNFDYDFKTKKGNSGFDAFLKDGVWKWVKPKEMIDTNWADNGKGKDRYPDSMLDFNFVAGAAKDWKAECRVIVREGDFPDDEKTSDHRPVELILRTEIE